MTYPYLTRLFRDLDVPVIKSEMSFAASIDNGRIEYGLNNLGSILAQKRNLLRPAYYRMIADIVRFGKEAEGAADDDRKTIGDLVDELRLGNWFRDNYLMPMCGAIWSTPSDDVGRFPARSLVRFFRNHALLAGCGKHQWWTVKGGSIEYVRRVEAALLRRGCKIRTGQPVTGIARIPFGVTVQAAGGDDEDFDEVIFCLSLRSGPWHPQGWGDRCRGRGARQRPLSAEPGDPAPRCGPDAKAPGKLGKLGLPVAGRYCGRDLLDESAPEHSG